MEFYLEVLPRSSGSPWGPRGSPVIPGHSGQRGWCCPPRTPAGERGFTSTRLRRCLQAVMLDSTDVSLWYKIGHVALRLIRVPPGSPRLRKDGAT